MSRLTLFAFPYFILSLKKTNVQKYFSIFIIVKKSENVKQILCNISSYSLYHTGQLCI